MGNPVRIPATRRTPPVANTEDDEQIMSLVINDTAPAADGPYLYEENSGDATYAYIERWM